MAETRIRMPRERCARSGVPLDPLQQPARPSRDPANFAGHPVTPSRRQRAQTQWFQGDMVRGLWVRGRQHADQATQWCKWTNGFDRLIPATSAMVFVPARGDHCATPHMLVYIVSRYTIRFADRIPCKMRPSPR
jgi:hypothetical protein